MSASPSKKATLHIHDIDKTLDDDYTVKDLTKIVKKLGLNKKWKHGDVVQVKKDVDRNDYKYMWYEPKGKTGKLIDLLRKYDDYGSVPFEFAIGAEGNEGFTANYWSGRIVHNELVPVVLSKELVSAINKEIKNARKKNKNKELEVRIPNTRGVWKISIDAVDSFLVKQKVMMTYRSRVDERTLQTFYYY